MDLRTSRRQSDTASPAVTSSSTSSLSSTSSRCSDPTTPAGAAVACNNNSSSSTSQGKKCVNRQSQQCSVCGDRAYYVFYGAVACDSCRTFFRRQVLHSKDLCCHFSSTCQIQQNTRKDCASCRLDKCLVVGMKKSLVAVGEAESTRTACCRSIASPPQLPAAVRDVLPCRSKSVSEIPALLSENPVHVAEACASGVRMRRDSGLTNAASSAVSEPHDGLSEDEQQSLFTRHRDHHCHESGRRSSSHIPRSTFLSMSDVYYGNSVPIQMILQANDLPVIGDKLPYTNSICRETNFTTSRDNNLVSRLPILATRLNQPLGLQTQVHRRKSDENPTNIRDEDSASSSSEKWGKIGDTSEDSCESEPGRNDGVVSASAGYGSGCTTVSRKLIHPKFKHPAVSLTIELSSKRVIHVKSLSSTERIRFKEFMDATRCMMTGVGTNFRMMAEKIRKDEKETSFIPTVILVCAKMLLAIAEKLAVFSLLPRQDKEVLLKGSLTEILFLQSAKFFNPSLKCWDFGSDETECGIPNSVPISVLQVAGADVYARYSKFVSAFDSELYDEVISNLMCVICFLTERNDPLIQKNHISSERSLYVRLLNQYLVAKNAAGSDLSPAEAFKEIQAKFDELTSMKEIYERSNVDLDNIDQLVLNYQQLRLGSPPLAGESLCHGEGESHVPVPHTVTSPS